MPLNKRVLSLSPWANLSPALRARIEQYRQKPTMTPGERDVAVDRAYRRAKAAGVRPASIGTRPNGEQWTEEDWRRYRTYFELLPEDYRDLEHIKRYGVPYYGAPTSAGEEPMSLPGSQGPRTRLTGWRGFKEAFSRAMLDSPLGAVARLGTGLSVFRPTETIDRGGGEAAGVGGTIGSLTGMAGNMTQLAGLTKLTGGVGGFALAGVLSGMRGKTTAQALKGGAIGAGVGAVTGAAFPYAGRIGEAATRIPGVRQALGAGGRGAAALARRLPQRLRIKATLAGRGAERLATGATGVGALLGTSAAAQAAAGTLWKEGAGIGEAAKAAAKAAPRGFVEGAMLHGVMGIGRLAKGAMYRATERGWLKKRTLAPRPSTRPKVAVEKGVSDELAQKVADAAEVAEARTGRRDLGDKYQVRIGPSKSTAPFTVPVKGRDPWAGGRTKIGKGKYGIVVGMPEKSAGTYTRAELADAMVHELNHVTRLAAGKPAYGLQAEVSAIVAEEGQRAARQKMRKGLETQVIDALGGGQEGTRQTLRQRGIPSPEMRATWERHRVAGSLRRARRRQRSQLGRGERVAPQEQARREANALARDAIESGTGMTAGQWAYTQLRKIHGAKPKGAAARDMFRAERAMERDVQTLLRGQGLTGPALRKATERVMTEAMVGGNVNLAARARKAASWAQVQQATSLHPSPGPPPNTQMEAKLAQVELQRAAGNVEVAQGLMQTAQRAGMRRVAGAPKPKGAPARPAKPARPAPAAPKGEVEQTPLGPRPKDAPKPNTAREAFGQMRDVQKLSEAQQVARGKTQPPLTLTPGQAAEPHRIYLVDVRKLRRDPQAFQTRATYDPKTGASGTLAGVKAWDPKAANIIGVFRDANEVLWVYDGHNRTVKLLDMLKQGKTKHTKLHAWVLDAKNGATPKKARAAGAETNIKMGRYKPETVAILLRDGQFSLSKLKEMGVSVESAPVRDGLGLSKLKPGAFDFVRNSPDLNRSQAGLVGEHMANSRVDAQITALRSLAVSPAATMKEAALRIRGVLAKEQGTAPDQPWLFTEKDEVAIKQGGKLAAKVRNRIEGQNDTARRAMRDDAYLQSLGETVLDKAELGKELKHGKILARLWGKYYQRAGPVNDLFTEGERILRNGNYDSAAMEQAVNYILKGLSKVPWKHYGEKPPPSAGGKRYAVEPGEVGILRFGAGGQPGGGRGAGGKGKGRAEGESLPGGGPNSYPAPPADYQPTKEQLKRQARYWTKYAHQRTAGIPSVAHPQYAEARGMTQEQADAALRAVAAGKTKPGSLKERWKLWRAKYTQAEAPVPDLASYHVDGGRNAMATLQRIDPAGFQAIVEGRLVDLKIRPVKWRPGEGRVPIQVQHEFRALGGKSIEADVKTIVRLRKEAIRLKTLPDANVATLNARSVRYATEGTMLDTVLDRQNHKYRQGLRELHTEVYRGVDQKRLKARMRELAGKGGWREAIKSSMKKSLREMGVKASEDDMWAPLNDLLHMRRADALSHLKEIGPDAVRFYDNWHKFAPKAWKDLRRIGKLRRGQRVKGPYFPRLVKETGEIVWDQGNPWGRRPILKNISAFFQKHRGPKGEWVYEQNPIAIANAYMQKYMRMKHIEPAVHEVNARAELLPRRLKGYAQWLSRRLGGIPETQPGFENESFRKFDNFVTSMAYTGALGLHPGSALTNLTQFVNTLTELDLRADVLLKGFQRFRKRRAFSEAGKEYYERMGVVQHWQPSYFEEAMGPGRASMDKLMWLFQTSEYVLRGVSFEAGRERFLKMHKKGKVDKLVSGSRLRGTGLRHDVRSVIKDYLRRGMVDQAAAEYGREVSIRTQYGYGRLSAPRAFQLEKLPRFATQFLQFPTYTAEMVGDYVARGQWNKLGTLVGLHYGLLGLAGAAGVSGVYKFGTGVVPEGMPPGVEALMHLGGATTALATGDKSTFDRHADELWRNGHIWFPAGRLAHDVLDTVNAARHDWEVLDDQGKLRYETSLKWQLLDLLGWPREKGVEIREALREEKYQTREERDQRTEYARRIVEGDRSAWREAARSGLFKSADQLRRRIKRFRRQRRMPAAQRAGTNLGRRSYARLRERLQKRLGYDALPPWELRGQR